jgi:hypothetical protein
MNDNYQAVYDAVRSRFHQPDIESVARQCFDTSFMQDQIKVAWQESAAEQSRPFVLLKPRLFSDGNMWCALYGENLQEGLAGFGTSPAKAAWAFDAAFYTEMPEKQS